MKNSTNISQSVKQIQTFVLNHDDTISVSVVFSDDSEWSGTVSMERYDSMKQEELIYEVDNVELLESDIETDLFTFMNNNSHIFGLCAWCRSYFTRSNDQVVFQLTSEEFEMTTHPESGVGHSCCGACNENQKQELNKYREMKKTNTRVNSNKGNIMKRAILMILVAVSLMAMSACSNPTGPRNVETVNEYPQIKGMDIPDTNLPIIEPII